MTNSPDDLWRDYETTLSSFNMLAEIRFKLLALLPTLSGFAIGLITFNLDAFKAAPGPRFLVGLLGFAVTMGLTFYDQRNTELYNALASRAKQLERALGLHGGGQFTTRPARNRKFAGFVSIWHDRALALIYGSVLGAWLFPLFCGGLWLIRAQDYLPITVPRFSASIAIAGSLWFVLELHHLDSPGTTRRAKLASLFAKGRQIRRASHDSA